MSLEFPFNSSQEKQSDSWDRVLVPRRRVDLLTCTEKAGKKQLSLFPDTKSEDFDPTFATIVCLFIFGVAIKTLNDNRHTERVPKAGEYLLYLFLSKKDREYLIGDLAEEYLEVQLKFGRRAAHFWYYKQVVASIWPLICKAVRWGLIAWLGQLIRRLI